MTSRSAPIHRQTTRPHQWPCRSQAIHCRCCRCCCCCHHPQSIPQQTRSSRHQQQLRLRRHRCAPPQSRPPMMMMMMCRQHAQPRFRHSRSRARHSGIRCRHCRSRPHQRPHTCRRHHQHLRQRTSRRCIPTRHRCHRPTTRLIAPTHRRCCRQHRLRPSQSSRHRSIPMHHHHRCHHFASSRSHQLQCHLLQHRPPALRHRQRCRHSRQLPVCCRTRLHYRHHCCQTSV